MDASQEKANIVTQSDVFRQNSARLQLESFKIDSFITLFNNCADRCNLQFKESGLRDTSAEDVTCFTSCINKTQRLSKFLES